MLAPDSFLPPVALLFFYLDAHGFCLGAENHGPTVEQCCVNIGGAFECKVAGPQDTRPVKPQNVSRQNPRHLEWKTDCVASRNQVRPPVDVDSDVVSGLRSQERQQRSSVG